MKPPIMQEWNRQMPVNLISLAAFKMSPVTNKEQATGSQCSKSLKWIRSSLQRRAHWVCVFVFCYSQNLRTTKRRVTMAGRAYCQKCLDAVICQRNGIRYPTGLFTLKRIRKVQRNGGRSRAHGFLCSYMFCQGCQHSDTEQTFVDTKKLELRQDKGTVIRFLKSPYLLEINTKYLQIK